MRIGIDIDEVLCGTNDYFIYEFNKKHKTKIKKEDFVDYNFKTIKGYESEYVLNCLIKHIRENLEYYEIFNNSKRVLTKLKKENNELYIITSRYKEFEKKTIEWLEEKFGKDFFNKILIYNETGVEANKAEVAEKNGIEILIEDMEKYIIDAAKRGINVLMMDHPWNSNVKETERITRVFSWKDIEKKIEEIKKKKIQQ